VASGDVLTLNISLVRLRLFSSTVFYLWFCWVFHTFYLFDFNSKNIFNLSVWFLIHAMYFAFQLQTQGIDKVKILSF